MHVGLIRST